MSVLLKCNLKFLTINTRGLKDSVKRKAMFLYCKSKRAECILLQETHSNETDEKFWASQWGDKIVFSHGTSRSAGVAILFNNCQGKILATKSDDNGHWIVTVLQLDDSILILGNIYGHCNKLQNRNLLSKIQETVLQFKRKYVSENVILGGDWNMVKDDWIDRLPSKYNSTHLNSMLSDWCESLNLTDIWRQRNPCKRQYSWFKPDASAKSRLDYWLITDNILNQISNCEILPAPLTDHCCVELNVSPLPLTYKNNGYWKFNSRLLLHSDFCQGIESLIQNVIEDESLVSFTQKWEFLKYKIRQYSISYGKQLKKKNILEEEETIKNILTITLQPTISENEQRHLIQLQEKLDKIYEIKAQGAYIRSRAKWMEDGEKNTSYFCRLEKRRQERKTIKSLMINGVECSNETSIANKITEFYQKLYSSSYSAPKAEDLLKQIKQYIPQIDNDFKESCEKDIDMAELNKAVMCLKLDRSPGTDGLTGNFYRHFWQSLKNLLFQVFNETINNSTLSTSMKQGIITLIPKPDKDTKLIENYRPISLLNNDYKLLTYIYTNRLKKKLDTIISETQSGFVNKRSIHNNIRLVKDLLDYNDQIEDKGFILFLDFQKAFDQLEHKFLFEVLRAYGFGPKFCRIIETFYTDTTSSVILPNGSTPRFSLKRGVKQGCNISPFLFIMAVEILAIMLKNSNMEKLNIFNEQLVISQLADDTTIFLKKLEQIPEVLKLIDTFSEASGLTLNRNKCELMAIHDCDLSEAYNIPIKSCVKYLGINITKDAAVSESLNIQSKINQCKSKLCSWLQRDLTVFGRVYLTKMESLARCIYPAYSMAIPEKVIKAINQLNFNFIWKNKIHYIKKSDIVKEYKEGGLNAIDFHCLNAVLKVKWLKSFLTEKDSIWFCLSKGLFNKIGGIEFVLRCDFNADKLPIKLSSFHKQVLLSWKLMYNHNFTPHQTPLWNNRYVLCNRKSVFLQHWMDKGVWSLRHLMDDHGNWLPFENFCALHNILCQRSEFKKILKAIPQAVKQQMENMDRENLPAPNFPNLRIYEQNFLGKTIPNKSLRKSLNTQLFPTKPNKNAIIQKFSETEVKIIRTEYLTLPVNPKTKEIHFKILNGIYPSSELLRKRFNFEQNNCVFCENDIETTEHLFYHCIYTRTFWDDLWDWLSTRIQLQNTLDWDTVVFGLLQKDSETKIVMNNILLLAKYFIHACKWRKVKPIFIAFKRQMQDNYVKSLKLMSCKNAILLMQALENLHIFEDL